MKDVHKISIENINFLIKGTPVNSLSTPGPNILVLVKLLKLELDQSFLYALILLLQQSFLPDEVLLVKLDLESFVGLYGRCIGRQLLAPEGDELLDPEHAHGQVAHVTNAVITTNLNIAEVSFRI